MRWRTVADTAELQRTACRRIVDAAGRAVNQRGEFLIVLAGGNTPRGIYQRLRKESCDWLRWKVYFGDERCLPADDPQRNSKMAADAWLDHTPIPKGNVHAIPGELGARAAALAYIDTLRAVREFDLVLLGLGEDGHTAGLFPGHEWGTAPHAPDVLAVFDSPKPPQHRVSLSAARLSRTREVLFLVAGESKRTAAERWRAGERLPAAAIHSPAGIDVLISN